MENVSTVANATGVWIAAAPIVLLTLLQACLYYRQVFHAAETVDLDKRQLQKAFKTGAITAIGPVIAIFIIMVGLMSVIGAPMAWMRLSVVGAAPRS